MNSERCIEASRSSGACCVKLRYHEGPHAWGSVVFPPIPGTLDASIAPDAFASCADADIEAIRRVVHKFRANEAESRVDVVVQLDGRKWCARCGQSFGAELDACPRHEPEVRS